jgi:hypothetical protein
MSRKWKVMTEMYEPTMSPWFGVIEDFQDGWNWKVYHWGNRLSPETELVNEGIEKDKATAKKVVEKLIYDFLKKSGD